MSYSATCITIVITYLTFIVSADELLLKPVSTSSSASNSSSSYSKPRTAAKVYNSCGSNCPQTCAYPEPRACIKSCNADFFCPPGYLENSSGVCVVKEDCDKSAQSTPTPKPSPQPAKNPDKVYSKCGTACPKTCANPEPEFCTLQCVEGYFCPSNYYENSAGKCVLKEDCDKSAQSTPTPKPTPQPAKNPDKVYSKCGTFCPKTCANPDPKFCALVCKEGYFCPTGYLENSAGKCVLKEDCDVADEPVTTPKPSPQPEKNPDKAYSTCGTACPKTCANPEPEVCTLQCVEGYFCPSNYYENSAGKCVLKEDCDKTVQPNPIPSPKPSQLPRPRPRPQPRPRPFPFSGFGPQRPPPPPPPPHSFQFPFPDQFSDQSNFVDIPENFGQFTELPNFEPFNLTSDAIDPRPKLPILTRPRPVFQIDPIEYDPSTVSNGAAILPPALIRTTGSNLPSLPRLPEIVPKFKPLIDFDPTFPRPTLRIKKD